MRTLFAIALAAALQCGWAQDRTVTLYTSLAPTESGPLAQAFEKKTGIRVELWRAPSRKGVQRAPRPGSPDRLSVPVHRTQAPGREVVGGDEVAAADCAPHP